MRAKTKGKHGIRKRFAIVIGVAAAGVMALGVQTASAATYNTKLTITQDQGSRGHTLIHGHVNSGGGKKCEVGRKGVTLFKQRPGADRKLGVAKVTSPTGGPMDGWEISVPRVVGEHVYAKVRPKVGDGFVCSGGRSPTYTVK